MRTVTGYVLAAAIGLPLGFAWSSLTPTTKLTPPLGKTGVMIAPPPWHEPSPPGQRVTGVFEIESSSESPDGETLQLTATIDTTRNGTNGSYSFRVVDDTGHIVTPEVTAPLPSAESLPGILRAAEATQGHIERRNLRLTIPPLPDGYYIATLDARVGNGNASSGFSRHLQFHAIDHHFVPMSYDDFFTDSRIHEGTFATLAEVP